MEEKKEPPGWGQIGCMYSIVIVVACSFWLARRKPPDPIRDAEEAARIAAHDKMMDDLDAKLKHPLVAGCFQAGHDFGARHKATGLARLEEKELDVFALAFVGKLDLTDDLRGHAVRKFKSGYGWGYWGGQ